MASDYDLSAAFKVIEDELTASMIRNLKHHRAEETKEGYEWSMWQAEQLKALEKYKRENQKKYKGQFEDINAQIEAMIRAAKEQGGTDQEQEILRMIKNGFKGQKAPRGATAEFFKLNERKLGALIQATTRDMQTAETAVLRCANDQYRKIIYNAQVYANTGAGTYEKSVDMATRDFLKAGIDCIEYANGSRHTIADYADMAIRTASKRAYLQGEGEKRQEWGICTVIVNKRGNPCPKCLPHCGKVYIDDVWSNGPKTGISPVTGIKYPLMSAAVSAGLYHPRCKDSHTTYFEGVSTPPEGSRYTWDELDRIAERYKADQKQQYAERQAEKYDRLSKYSLDSENQRTYSTRAEGWAKQAGYLKKFVEIPKGSDIIRSERKDLSKYLGQKITATDNQSIREWYYANVNDIPNQIDQSKSFDEQVKRAFELRNNYKHEARVAMSDRETAELLEKERPAKAFEELVGDKMRRKKMTRQEALEDILKTASKTNADVNKEFDL